MERTYLESKSRELLNAIHEKQINTNGQGHNPCPRCGEHSLADELILNPLSRHENVYICDACGMEEAAWDWEHKVLPLYLWDGVRASFHKPGYWCSANFNVTDFEISDDGKSVETLGECWFDCESKFGLDLSDDDTWINLYVTYNPETKDVSVIYTVDDDEFNRAFSYIPTEKEKDMLRFVVERDCQKECRCSVTELLEKHRTPKEV